MTDTTTTTLFSISDVERLSGIKAHTLRTWESRHDMLQPVRNNTGARFYTLQQLHEIFLLALLNRNGYRISNLAKLSVDALEEKVSRLQHDDDRQQMAQNRLLLCMYELNPISFDTILQECFVSWPVTEVFEQIVYPFLVKTELLWQGSRLTEEHLAVTAIRKKLLAGIDGIVPDKQQSKKVVLFLHDTRQLDLGLLYFYFQLKRAGVQAIYMGNDVTIENLTAICQRVQPHYLYTYLSPKSKLPLEQLRAMISGCQPYGQLIYSRPLQDAPPDAPQPGLQQMDYENAMQFLAGVGVMAD